MADGYHDGSRALQDRFDTRRLADRLHDMFRSKWTLEDVRPFVEAAPMFFLATADRDGHPQCSYKGGAPGFVQILAPMELCFPSYDGNGMFLSFGNVLENPHIQMLFIDFEQPNRDPGVGSGHRHRRSGSRRPLPRRPVRDPRRGRRRVPELPALHPPQRRPRAVGERPRRRGRGTDRRVEVHADVQRGARRRRPGRVPDLSRRAFLALAATVVVGACSDDDDAAAPTTSAGRRRRSTTTAPVTDARPRPPRPPRPPTTSTTPHDDGTAARRSVRAGRDRRRPRRHVGRAVDPARRRRAARRAST